MNQTDFHLSKKTALILVDIQKGLDDWAYYGGQRNNLGAEANAAHILNWFRKLKWPVFHIRHSSQNSSSPLHASKPCFQIKEEVAPLAHETVHTKNVNSAFIGTPLEKDLHQLGCERVVIVGLTTNHCVSSSVRMAANLGFDVILVADATACFDAMGIDGTKYEAALVHHTCLASLKDEFATICSTEALIQQLPSW